MRFWVFFSTKNLIKSVFIVYAVESCFKLCGVKSKPTNNACDFEPRDSYEKDSYNKETVYFIRNSVFFRI